MESILLILVLVIFVIVVFVIDQKMKARRITSRKVSQKVAPNTALQVSKINQEILDRISSDFISVGWTIWDSSVHYVPGQMDRIRRAATDHHISVIEYNPDTKVALVSSSKEGAYAVSEYGCECMDFRTRGLPCKHMYLLAMELSEKQRQ